MSYTQLLQNMGFTLDPFAKTNADEEEKLAQYFISPPFFAAVQGEIATPKSAIVFAPRGGGKTALKRKMEIGSIGENFLCITYNQFDVSGLRANDITLDYHLRNIVRLVLVAVITAAAARGVTELNNDDRHLLYLLAKSHLSKLDQTQLKESVSAIQNFGDKALDFWNKFTGPIGFVLNALLAKVGLGAAELQKFDSSGGALGSLLDQLRVMRSIAYKLDYCAIYVLVDKVDENALTGKATSSFEFIQPILSDLQLLELPGYGFKLFLWDQLLEDYQRIARPDRVKYYRLKWSLAQLETMLHERLKAYSEGKVKSLQEIADFDGPCTLDEAVARFCGASPRTAIRICKEIMDQQSEIDAGSKRISQQAIRRGFNQIARNTSFERFPDGVIRDLQRTKRCDFTIRHLYSNIFKFTQQAGLNKVKVWEDAGAVEGIGTIQETAGAKGSNHYSLTDWLLAKHVFSDLNIEPFIRTKVCSCPNCGELLLRDWDIISIQTCNHCQCEVTAPPPA